MSLGWLREDIANDNHRSTGEDHHERAKQTREPGESSGQGGGMPANSSQIHSGGQAILGAEEGVSARNGI
jgi:hypothetical protein